MIIYPQETISVDPPEYLYYGDLGQGLTYHFICGLDQVKVEHVSTAHSVGAVFLDPDRNILHETYAPNGA